MAKLRTFLSNNSAYFALVAAILSMYSMSVAIGCVISMPV